MNKLLAGFVDGDSPFSKEEKRNEQKYLNPSI